MACRFEILLPARPRVAWPPPGRRSQQADRIEHAWSVFRDDSQLSQLNRAAAAGPCPARRRTRPRCSLAAAGSARPPTARSTSPRRRLSRCWRLLQRDGQVPGPEALAEARAPHWASPGRVCGDDRHDRSLHAPRRRTEPRRHRQGLRRGAHRRRPAPGRRRRGSRLGRRQQRRGRRRAAGGWPIASARTRRAAPVCGCRAAPWHQRRRRTGHSSTTASASGTCSTRAPAGRPAACRASRSSAPDAADADALATAFFVGGPALAARYLADHDDVLVVFTLDGSSRPRIMGRASGATVEV